MGIGGCGHRDGVGGGDAAAALMASFARPCKICSCGDSQNASAEQLGQFGAAVQAVHCTRWVGVVLCTRAAVTIRWLWADLRGPVGTSRMRWKGAASVIGLSLDAYRREKSLQATEAVYGYTRRQGAGARI